MTDLEKHIISLLLDNDCVIVPGFGGFMVHRIAAYYDEHNNVFLPPKRTVGFNPRLTMNDSLLAQAYVSCYEISYPEALKRIEQEVDILKQQIEQEREHNICGIGCIQLLDSGKYDFIPEASGLISPCTYGFESFEMARITTTDDAKLPETENTSTTQIEAGQPLTSQIFNNATAIKPQTTVAAENEPNEERKESSPKIATSREEISVHIPMRMIKQFAAACVVIFVLLSFPSRLGDSSTSATKRSSIDTNFFYEIMPKDITSGKPDSLSMTPATGQEDINKTVATIEATDDTVQQSPAFSIVLASRITLKNAQDYVDRLHRQGLVDAKVYTSGKNTMVVYKRFADKQHANSELAEISGKKEFADSWITTIK